MRYQVESVHSVDSEGPQGALRRFLEELLVGGRPVDFLVREVGGRGGGVVRVRVVSPEDDFELEERPIVATLAGISRTVELDRRKLVDEVLERGRR